MHPTRFDILVRSFSRRVGLRGLAATALGLVGTQTASAQTCKTNGERCTDGADCCSGRCKRNPTTGRRRCRAAPDQGLCSVVDDFCANNSPLCNSTGSEACGCWVTTRGFSFCGDLPVDMIDACFDCDRDADCEARPDGVGQPGDRCVRCAANCVQGTKGTACVRECPSIA